MCSNNTCSGETKYDSHSEKLLRAKCRKCEEQSAKIVLQRKFPYCQECFLLYFSHKYNGGLGKSKLLRKGDKVLVAFSGSPYGICLIDLIFRSLIADRKKKTKFEVEIIFIDERYNLSKEERREIHLSINNFLSRYEYKVYYTFLYPVDNEIVLLTNSDLNDSDNYEIEFPNFLIKSETSRQDLIIKLRNDVLFRAAMILKCNKIFTAEASDHIASNILSNLALGRGKQLASITSMVDKRGDIVLIRPLRECSKKEIIFYNLFNNLSYDFNSVLEKDKFSSIQKLSEIFVTELLQSFPSTVSTVVSTGNKLSLNSDSSDNICFLCQSALDPEINQLSALDALKISNMVSKIGSAEALKSADFILQENGNCEELKKSQNENPIPLNEENLIQKLCYSCRRILNETSTEDNWLQNKIFQMHKVHQENRMHSEIKDFLL